MGTIFATAPTVSAVAKGPHFFIIIIIIIIFLGPLSDWSEQTVLFSHWSPPKLAAPSLFDDVTQHS